MDILRESAEQGALAKEVIGQQGLITEAGYEEQAQSYGIMAATARMTAAGEEQIADETKSAGLLSAIGGVAGGLLKGAAAVAGLATGTGLFGDAASAVGGFAASSPTDPSNPLVINRYGTPGPVSSNPLGGIY